MNFLQSIVEVMKGWGAVEWSFVATIVIELFVILFYNKGALKCQEKLLQYEVELKELKEQNERLQTVNDDLTQIFNERGDN